MLDTSSTAAARTLLVDRASTLSTLHAAEEDPYRALLTKHEHGTGRAFERINLERPPPSSPAPRTTSPARRHEQRQLALVRDGLRAGARAVSADLHALL